MAPTIQEIRERLGDIVYSEIDEELPDTLIKMLQQRRQSVAAIEYGEAALLGYWLAQAQDRHAEASVPTSFHGSLSFNDLHQAFSFFSKESSGSAESLKRLAALAHQQFACDWVVMVGAYPKVHGTAPTATASDISKSGTSGEAVPLDILVSRMRDGVNEITHKQVLMSGHPDVLQHRIAKAALDQLRYSLLSSSS